MTERNLTAEQIDAFKKICSGEKPYLRGEVGFFLNLLADLAAAESELKETKDLLRAGVSHWEGAEELKTEVERLRGALHPERLARNFHRIYERLAPSFSYTTRKESAVPFDDLPDNNKNLMLAVCSEIVELAEDMGNQAAPEKPTP
ncbi:hypothetical protein LCGC14_1016360 [marine sediment metagenome]|uniref:Uncharacterized protein n=1 Tax=marine sediment metagenome TaxID=412755 RepID=A0A0F9R4T9_9ZZZZ